VLQAQLVSQVPQVPLDPLVLTVPLVIGALMDSLGRQVLAVTMDSRDNRVLQGSKEVQVPKEHGVPKVRPDLLGRLEPVASRVFQDLSEMSAHQGRLELMGIKDFLDHLDH
jgi:hypothetical protein